MGFLTVRNSRLFSDCQKFKSRRESMDLTTWQNVLEQLRAQMPRAQFETWVRDTRAISCENGVLTVAARNGYACEWLENHIWADAVRLSGAQDVRFVVVVEGPSEEDGEEDDAPEAEAELETNRAAAEEDSASPQAEEVEIDAAEYTSLYEQVVHPERAVYLPGYFSRWLAEIGPDLGWFYLGFRQAAYAHGARRGRYGSARFSSKQISALCGTTERTFWNRVGRAETWERLNGLIAREERRYVVAMSLPLTRGDTNALAYWLRQQSGQTGEVLEAACHTPMEELFASGGESGSLPPMTVSQLLREVFPQDTTAQGYAERLRLHLMPQSDQIVISLFFLEHILPWLKAGAAWVYVLLRDRCYVDRAGSGRNSVTVKGGYQEIASWLGITRPQTVYDWLREPVSQVYLAAERLESGNGKWNNPLRFRVLLNDVPAEIVQAAATQERWTGNGIFSIGLAKVTQISVSGNANFSTPVTHFSVSGNANFSTPVTHFSVFCNALFSVLNPLTLKTKPLNPDLTNQPAREKQNQERQASGSAGRSPEAPVSGLDSQVQVQPNPDNDGWDFDAILNRLSVNPISRRRLREENVPPETFLAWLLEAMTMRGVDPVRVAVAWTLNPRRRDEAGEDFKILARSPRALRTVARQYAIGRRYSAPWGEDRSQEELEVSQVYQRALGVDSDRAASLLRILFGETIEFAEAEKESL
jgi:hypothetical protein